MDGVGDKWVVLEFASVLLFRVMKINRPGTWHASIGEIFLGDYVVLIQHDVTHQSPGFTRAANVGNPCQEGIFVLRSTVAILHRVECTIDGSQVPVANRLGPAQRVFVESAFPEPLAMERSWVWEILHVQI